MAGAYILELNRGGLESSKQYGGGCATLASHVHPPLATWRARVWPSTPVSGGISRPAGYYKQTTLEAPRRQGDSEDPSLQGPLSPKVELHIFRPVQTSRQRRAGKLLNSGRNQSTNGARVRVQSPYNSPSKFELAAVAALCKPEAAAPASPCRLRQAPHFPPASSFVPGRQFPRSTQKTGGQTLPAAHDAPGSFMPRPDRKSNKAGLEQLPTLSNRPLAQSFICPFSARPATSRMEDVRQPETQGSLWAPLDQKDMAAANGEAAPLILPSSQMCSSPFRRWQFQRATGSKIGEVLFKPQEAPVSRVAAAGITCKGFPYIAATKQPVSSNVVLLPNNAAYSGGNAEPFVPRWEAPLPTECQSIRPVAVAGAAVSTYYGQEEPQELVEDSSADVIAAYTTDRFWQLMDVLAELQRGPTSLLSSSVTFDSVMLPGGELQYALIEKGSFGRVFMGSHHGSKVAIKVPVESMLRSDAAGVMERILNEWQILSLCEHPNVVRLVGGIVHGPFDVWLVTQLANGSDLHSRKYSRNPLVQRVITAENGLYMCRQLAAVVAYLHAPMPGRKPVVVHRDIKPENVLIADDWSIQLCDFGDAEASLDGRVSRISGATWFYAPAELLRCSPVECMMSEPGARLPSFNEKWDIWSMGCVFQEMFGFLNPMHVHISSRDSPNVIYQKLKAKAIAGSLVPGIAKEIQGIARTIISRCLDPNPETRPSAAEVVQMWSASDHEILKDIILGQSSYKVRWQFGLVRSCGKAQRRQGGTLQTS
ncbi:hypothetical protein Efla_002899 [Eimeria flavescens]